jgi:DNA-binding MarR family transcriptional regulator
MGQDHLNLRDDVADVLQRCTILLTRHLAGSGGHSLSARAVLSALDDEGATRLTALAASGGITQPAMTQLVGRLERDGLVVRLVDPDDGRATVVDITDNGRDLLADRRQAVRDRLAELLETLPPHDEATLALTMRVALPLIDRLLIEAADKPAANVSRHRTAARV